MGGRIDEEKVKKMVEEAKEFKKLLEKLGVFKEDDGGFPGLPLAMTMILSMNLLSALSSIDNKLSGIDNKLSYLLGMTSAVLGLLIAVAARVFGL